MRGYQYIAIILVMNSMAVIGANFDVDFGFCSILSDFLILF
jgi:hypothetical protein